jgi:DNA mismatch repair protein MutS
LAANIGATINAEAFSENMAGVNSASSAQARASTRMLALSYVNTWTHFFKTTSEHRAWFVLGHLYAAFLSYAAYFNCENVARFSTMLQDVLIHVARYIDNVKKLQKILYKHKKLLAYIPELSDLYRTMSKKHGCPKMQHVLKALNTNTFKGKSSAFSWIGRILSTHRLMEENHAALNPALHAIGCLDAHHAIATIMKQHANTKASMCFATIRDDGPYVNAQEFWNPFIDPNKVVTNSIILGLNKPNNLILTGPNTGGKTTVLKALIINLLFAQSFGVACADHFEFSPFSIINCYMDVQDDLAGKKSLFAAEVARAKELLATLNNLTYGQYAFSVIDEIFTGTEATAGQKAAYEVALQFGLCSKSITLIATHYHNLIDLEEETSGYANAHVKIIRHPDNRIERTYTLVDGPSTVNIVMDILAEEGLVV